MRVIGLWFFTVLMSVAGWAQQEPVLDVIRQLHLWTIYDSHFDQDGNYYITGRYLNGDNFDIRGGTSTLGSTDFNFGDGYVAKYDFEGNLLWVEPFSGSGTEYPRRIKVDADGNVYVSGSFVDGVTLNTVLDFDPDDAPGSFTVVNAGDYDGFLVSFDPNGNYRWHFENSTTGYDECSGFDFGTDGNLYHIGAYGNVFNIDRINMSSGDWQDAIVLSGDNAPYGGDLTVTEDGLLFVSGNFYGTITLDPNNPAGSQLFSNGGSWDGFTAYYSMSDLKYAGDVKQFGGNGEDILLDAVYRNGEVYLMGYFYDTFNFPEGSLISAGGRDFFVIKYDPGSFLAWADQFGGSGDEYVEEMDFTSTGHVYLTGTMMNTVDFDPDPFGQWLETSSDGFRDAFVLKLNQYGWLEHVQRLGSAGDDFVDVLAVDNRDRVLFAHYYPDYINVDVDPSPGGLYPTTAFNMIRYYDPPNIDLVYPEYGRPGTSVFIAGSNFSHEPEKNVVYFGATRAEVLNAQPDLLIVETPTGSTYEPISIAVNGYTAYSHKPFHTTFDMYGDIATSYSVPIQLSLDGVSKRGSVADLDEDGKPDIVVPVPVAGSDKVSVFTNQSAVANLSPTDFSRVDLGTGASPYATAIADLDGDGLRDIIIGEHDSGNITILSGDGSSKSLFVGGQVVFVAAHDLDADGKPEVIAASLGDYLMVFENDSQPGFISFPFAGVTLPTSIDPWSLAVGDIDIDGKPDIVSIDGGGVFRVFRNVSVTGQIDGSSFNNVYNFFYAGYYVGVVLSDLDSDGLLDAVVSGESTINILKNNSSPGIVSFDASFPAMSSANVWNAFVADLNGDAKPDIISANIDHGKLTVYRNATTPGVINASSFPTQEEVIVSGTSRPLQVSVSDLDGDTRPDLVVTDESSPTVWIFRNLNAAIEPADQPTALYFSEVTGSTAFGRFTPAASDPDGYIVIRKSGETPSTEVPTDGVAYPVGSILNDGAVVVYSGNQPFFNASGLFETDGAETFSVYSFNGGYSAVNYYTETEPLSATIYQSTGTPLHNTYFHWAKQIGGDLAKGPGEIAVGPDGSVYLTGYFEDANTDFNPDPGIFQPAPKISATYHAFVAKYSVSGDLQWVQSIPSNSYAVGEGIGVDNSGNVYVLGKFVSDVYFYDNDILGYVSRVGNGGVDIFLAKYDATGNFQWTQTFGGPQHDEEDFRNGLEVDGDGYVYVTGEFRDNVFFNPSFGGENLTSFGGRDIYVAKYHPADGSMFWVRQIGGAGDDFARDLTVDAASGGNVVITGQVSSPDVFISGNTYHNHGIRDAIVVKFDNNGNLQWANLIGGPNADYGEGVTTDQDGAVYVTGTYSGHANFDGGDDINFLTSNSSMDETFLAKYASHGKLLWVKSMEANAPAYGIRIKADGLGSVYLLGDFQSTINADGNSGNYSLSQYGVRDIILSKYSADGFLRWAGVIGGTGNDYSADLAITPNDEVVITGTFDAELFVDPNNTLTSLVPYTSASDIFMVKLGPTEPGFGSVPTVSSFTPNSGPVGSFVTIFGSNFDPTVEGNTVYFGATQAVVAAAAPDELLVQVPVGATFEPITVTTRGLTAASDKPFIVTYLSGGTMDANSFDAVYSTSFEVPRGVEIADLDQDGFSDLIVISPTVSDMSILYNASTPGTIVLPERHAHATPANPYAVRTGDLDGDGRLDIALVGKDENVVSVYRNKGSRSFESRVNFSVGAEPTAVDIRDIDGDGKQDLVVSNGGSSSITILKNRSIPGSITQNSFGSRLDLGTGFSPTDIRIADMASDARPDIIVVNDFDGKVDVFKNFTSPGAILDGDFSIHTVFTPASQPLHVGLGDLDADGLTDLLATHPVSLQFSMIRNLGGDAGFSNQTLFSTFATDISIAVGDITGDGRLDVVTGYPQVFMNTGSPFFDNGLLSEITLNDANIREDVELGDIDGDGRPDIVLADEAGIFIYRNNSGIVAPTIQASAVEMMDRRSTSVDFGFTPGNGNKHMSVMRKEAPVESTPQDGVIYHAPTTENVFGTGSDLGNESYVVALGEIDWTAVTTLGLEPETEYHITVFEYSDLAGYTGETTADAKFLTEISANTASFYTLSTEPTSNPSTFFATAAGTAITLDFSPASDVSASGYLILRGESAVVPDFSSVVDGTTSLSIPAGTSFVAFVFDNAATSYVDVGLSTDVTYNYLLVPFAWRDGIGETANYYTDGGPLTASATTTQFANPPQNPPSGFAVENPTQDGFTISFAPSSETPSPSGYLAIRQLGADPTFVPVQGVEYTVGENPQNSEYIAFVGNTGTNPIKFVETGLAEATTYFYRIYSFNGSGSSIAYLTSQSLADQASTSAPDANAPSVTNLTPDAVQEGEGVMFTISVTDESPVQAFVYFRSVSSGEEWPDVPAAMNFDGTNYTYFVPPPIGELGLEYFFVAWDSYNNTYQDEFLRLVTISYPDEGLIIPYNSFGSETRNYRIVSVPLNLANKSMSAVFTDDLGSIDDSKWRVFRYQNGSTSPLSSSSPIDPGKGYWLIVKENPGDAIDSGPGETVDAYGDFPFSIPLLAGWNQIGNPYNFDLNWGAVAAANPNVPGAIVTFNGSGSTSTLLRKFEGGFIFMDNAGELLFPTENTEGGRVGEVEKLRNPIDQANWEVDLVVEQGDLTNVLSGIGMRSNASDGYDRYDGMSMPRFNDFLELNHHKELHGYSFTRDIVTTDESNTWEFSVASSSEERFITISWDNSYFGNNEKSLILWDVNLQLGIDMRVHTQYKFDRHASGNFRILFGDSDFLRENTRVNSLVFHHILPNPVRDEATFCFSLPEAGPVTIEVLDVTGRESDRVFEGVLEAGYHEVSYTNSDYNNAGGVYIARIKAGAASAQQRMVLQN